MRRLYVNINVFCVIVDERALDYAGNKRRVLCMLYGDDDERETLRATLDGTRGAFCTH